MPGDGSEGVSEDGRSDGESPDGELVHALAMTSASGASSRGTRAGSETRTPTDRVFAMPCTSRLNEGKPAACSVRCGALCHDPRRLEPGAAASEPGPRPLASSRLKSERRER